MCRAERRTRDRRRSRTKHGLLAPVSGLRRNSMACVALPTCGLALAESERYLPDLMTALDERLAAHGLADDDIVIRMTGCPNGCARPYLAEIGLVGKGPGRYNLYLGAAFDGSRLSKLYAEDLDHAGIIAALDPLFAAYAARAAERASASAISSSAPASSRRPATAATSTPMWAGKPNARAGDPRAKRPAICCSVFRRALLLCEATHRGKSSVAIKNP